MRDYYEQPEAIDDLHSDRPEEPAQECKHGVWWPEYCHECWRMDRDAFDR